MDGYHRVLRFRLGRHQEHLHDRGDAISDFLTNAWNTIHTTITTVLTAIQNVFSTI